MKFTIRLFIIKSGAPVEDRDGAVAGRLVDPDGDAGILMLRVQG